MEGKCEVQSTEKNRVIKEETVGFSSGFSRTVKAVKVNCQLSDSKSKRQKCYQLNMLGFNSIESLWGLIRIVHNDLSLFLVVLVRKIFSSNTYFNACTILLSN